MLYFLERSRNKATPNLVVLQNIPLLQIHTIELLDSYITFFFFQKSTTYSFIFQ